MVCNGKCQRLDDARRKGGYKMCKLCEMMFIWEGPCCNQRVQSNPRYKGNPRKELVVRL